IAVNPADRYEDIIEFVFELEHGAERASPINLARKPLYARDPLVFWKVVSALLGLLLLITVFTAKRPHGGGTAPEAGSVPQQQR
ncbi:MAG TPA: hypothetical protein VII39_06665, partial [Bradyrhizobium sp.]